MSSSFLKYFLIWILICSTFFIFSEEVVALLFPGFHDVEIWMMTTMIGILSITFIVIMVLVFQKKRNKTTQ